MRCIACGKDLVAARMTVTYDVEGVAASVRCHPGLERDEYGRLRILTCGDCALEHFGSMAEADWDEKRFTLLRAASGSGALRFRVSSPTYCVDTGLTLAQAVQRYVELRREAWSQYRPYATYFIRSDKP